jgi:HPt (histidine-containing phosphotransfer) domain-containing protein
MVQPAPSAADLALLDPDGLFRGRLAHDRRVLARHRNDIAHVRVVIHQLAGAAGTFGYAELGDIALALDDRLAEGLAVKADDIAVLIAALDQALDSSG